MVLDKIHGYIPQYPAHHGDHIVVMYFGTELLVTWLILTRKSINTCWLLLGFATDIIGDKIIGDNSLNFIIGYRR